MNIEGDITWRGGEATFTWWKTGLDDIFLFFFLSSRDYKDSLAFRTNSEMVN